jgi:hypothetical protein
MAFPLLLRLTSSSVPQWCRLLPSARSTINTHATPQSLHQRQGWQGFYGGYVRGQQ